MKKTLMGIVVFLGLNLLLPLPTFAQTEESPQQETLEGMVVGIVEEKKINVAEGVQQPYQKVEIELLGKDAGKIVTAEQGGVVVSGESQKLKPGDRVLVTGIKNLDGSENYYVTDFVRRKPLLFMTLAFALAVVVVGGVRGFSSFIGLLISFAVLLKYILPQIVAGSNPVLVAIIGSFAILFATLYLAHGISRKTTAAVMGTAISLVITGILAWLFVEAARLTGFGSEEAGFLSMYPGMTINLKGILLAGMIIGALGVLDDITIGQAACVFELNEANGKLSWRELFRRGLKIGQDHIASLVNTLVLAYAGASLPLLILFAVSGAEPIGILVNREMIANEIVRTLVGSLGLVSAVPITTAIAAKMAKKGENGPTN